MEILSAEEINNITADVWSRLLVPSLKTHVPDTTRDTTETICVRNHSDHQQYSAIYLDLYSKPKPASTDSDSEESVGVPFIEPKAVRILPSEFYDTVVARTKEECEEEGKAPQKSDKWLQARKYCITASQFGSAIGTSPYQGPDDLVAEKLWNTFQGNAATQWGNDHELHAQEAFCAWFSTQHKTFKFKTDNLIKFSDEPWIAVSPDGIVEYEVDGQIIEELVEFKCPAYLRNTVNHPYQKYTKSTPPHYLSQIQGIMGYLNAHGRNLRKCWFVVWQPHQTWITPHEFDAKYYADMHDKLRAWYFHKLLPAFAHKDNGLLAFGETVPTDVVVVE